MRDATIMAASGFTMLALFSLLSAANASRLNDIEEKVDIRNDLVSGKANYMPGAACVIATSTEQTPADIINYARACAKAHEDWLKEQQ